MLELKRGGRARVRTDTLELILLPCRSRPQKNVKFGHFTL